MAKGLTEKGLNALGYLKENTDGAIGLDIAEALGLGKGVYGVLNSLVKRELVGKLDNKITRKVIGKDGVEVEREYVSYFATEAGMNFVQPVDEA